MDFSASPRNPEEILRLIASVPAGRKVLEKFLPLFHQRKVTIEAYPVELAEKLRQAIGADQPIGACLINDGETGIIYLDLLAPVGILAPFLFHELIHSLDGSVWKAAKIPMNREAKDQVFLQAEVKAFNGQQEFIEEMKDRHPTYAAFLATQYPRAKILHERLTREDLAELYGFKVS